MTVYENIMARLQTARARAAENRELGNFWYTECHDWGIARGRFLAAERLEAYADKLEKELKELSVFHASSCTGFDFGDGRPVFCAKENTCTMRRPGRYYHSPEALGCFVRGDV